MISDITSLLKSLSSTLSIFSCFITFILSLFSNFITVFFAFSKSTSFSCILSSAIKLFYLTKYFIYSYTILLLRIFSTFYSCFLSIFIGFSSFTLYPSTYFLYITILLKFSTGWILINTSSLSFAISVNTTSFICKGQYIFMLTFLLASFWTLSPLYSLSFYYLFSILLLSSALYLLTTLSLSKLFSILFLLPLISFSFSL